MIRMNPVDSVVVLYSIFEKNHKKNLNVLILQHLSVKLLFLSIFTTLRSTYHRHIYRDRRHRALSIGQMMTASWAILLKFNLKDLTSNC